MLSTPLYQDLPLLGWVLLGLMGLLLLVEFCTRALRFLLTWRAEGRRAQSQHQTDLPSVSIVICVREQTRLLEYLPGFVEQQYPGDFNIIIVDDAGDELLSAQLEQFRQEHRLREIHITRVLTRSGDTLPPRKLSLAVGFKASTKDWIVMAQSDSHPVSQHWLETLMRSGGAQHDLLIGPCIFLGSSPRLAPFHRMLQRVYSLNRAMGRAGYARISNIYLGYRVNLAFRRQLFFEGAGAYAGFNHLHGGDDDLFTLRIGRKGRVGVSLAKESLMLQDGYADWDEFWRHYLLQRESFPFYPRSVRVRLTLDTGLRMLLFALFASLVILYPTSPIVLYGASGAILLRFIILYYGMDYARRKWSLCTRWGTSRGYGLWMDLTHDLFWPFLVLIAALTGRRASMRTYGLRDIRQRRAQTARSAVSIAEGGKRS